MTTAKQREAAIGRRGLAAVRPQPVEVYIATLDTGGISHSGREFMAVAYSEATAKAALFAAVKRDGLPEDYNGRKITTLTRLEEYFGVRVFGPVDIGTGSRVEA